MVINDVTKTHLNGPCKSLELRLSLPVLMVAQLPMVLLLLWMRLLLLTWLLLMRFLMLWMLLTLLLLLLGLLLLPSVKVSAGAMPSSQGGSPFVDTNEYERDRRNDRLRNGNDQSRNGSLTTNIFKQHRLSLVCIVALVDDVGDNIGWFRVRIENWDFGPWEGRNCGCRQS